MLSRGVAFVIGGSCAGVLENFVVRVRGELCGFLLRLSAVCAKSRCPLGFTIDFYSTALQSLGDSNSNLGVGADSMSTAVSSVEDIALKRSLVLEFIITGGVVYA